MKTFSELKRNLKLSFPDLKKVKVGILGDSATQHLCQAIKAVGYEYSLELDIFEADFNQIEGQIFDHSSELFEFKPEIIIIFQSSHKLLTKYNKCNPDQHFNFSDERLSLIQQLYQIIQDRLNAKVIYYNYAEINDSVFGNYSNKLTFSFLFQIRKLNYDLMNFAIENNNFFIADMSAIQNSIGKKQMFQPSIYVNTDMVLSIESLPLVAYNTLDTIGAITGKIIKCVILDLDNTLWGGIIGDDGIENIQIGNLGIGKSFSEFQYWIKKLKDRGIILAVCSKNDEVIAKVPFEKHPDMVLRLNDISVFVANWENKADNIRYIQSILNIGFDSMVFLDDNPFERNIVRENIPNICIPELPKDPADYLEYLYGLNLFETISFSHEDKERTKLYQTEAKRASFQEKFANEDQFLESLNMKSLVESFNKFNVPRVAQLSQRSNQFNLRTIRYSESDIEKLSISTDYSTFAFSLEDKYGDNGLICVVILKIESSKSLFIDSWLMSCRVLKRGMENFVLDTICDFAINNNFSSIKGEYISTTKNQLVKDHYQNLGFENLDGNWILLLDKFQPKIKYINKKQHNEQK